MTFKCAPAAPDGGSEGSPEVEMPSRQLVSKLATAGCCVVGAFATIGPLVAMATSTPATPVVTTTTVPAPGADGR